MTAPPPTHEQGETRRPRGALLFFALMVIGTASAVLLTGSGAPTRDTQARSALSGDPISPRDGTAYSQEPADPASTRSAVQITIRSPDAAPTITNDRHAPMFIDEDLAPGVTDARCIAVTNVGSRSARIRLFGTSVDRGLAAFVDLAVEASAPGTPIRCDDFTGSSLYRGTLKAFVDAHRDYSTGVDVPVAVEPQRTVTFRVSRTLADASPQGRSASADFIWGSRAEGDTTRTYQGPPAVEARNDQASDTTESLGSGGPGTALEIVFAVAKRGWVWLLLVLIVLLFLYVQDSIDRRDPKLAHARVYPDPDIGFDPPAPGAEGK